jgi:hypothetical protein
MDKGILQLLFDQRFLTDVLLGGRPLAGVAGSASSSNSSSSSGHLAPGGGTMGLLGGAAAAGAMDPQLAAELSQRKREVAGLEQQLQVSLLGLMLMHMLGVLTS